MSDFLRLMKKKRSVEVSRRKMSAHWSDMEGQRPKGGREGGGEREGGRAWEGERQIRVASLVTM